MQSFSTLETAKFYHPRALNSLNEAPHRLQTMYIKNLLQNLILLTNKKNETSIALSVLLFTFGSSFYSMPIPSNGISLQLIDEVEILCNTSLSEFLSRWDDTNRAFSLCKYSSRKIIFPWIFGTNFATFVT